MEGKKVVLRNVETGRVQLELEEDKEITLGRGITIAGLEDDPVKNAKSQNLISRKQASIVLTRNADRTPKIVIAAVRGLLRLMIHRLVWNEPVIDKTT